MDGNGHIHLYWRKGSLSSATLSVFHHTPGVCCIRVIRRYRAVFVDIWLRSNTRYAITSQRVLILRTAPTVKFTSLAIDRLPELGLDEKTDGSGTIRFGTPPGLYGRGFSGWSPSLDPTPQFLAIPDARNVFAQIQRLSATRL